jgi:eukaryotic-like serine/threonine-protein kinase
MTPERWRRVADLFTAALDRDPAARAALLSQATRDDPSLAAEVEALLASEQKAGDFLSTPALSPTLGAVLAAPGPSLEGRQIGPYRVLGEIGHGGMGTVYRAVREDDQYRKQVAIKLVRGGHDTASVLRRFKSERQILANLEHPNIARLIDGGRTEEGWPYFSMEYVEGQSIDRHCAALGVRETIEVFRTVCAAVQYAHQRLVIHRDLKPSNILVSTDGVPKLLDFGVAKLLDADVAGSADATASTVGPLMTPEYASPEQVRGEAVTTASDVYSLGVLLYELLAGKRAYEVSTRAPAEVIRVVCHETPAPPSAVAGRPRSHQLAGDLDTIVLKAIRKEPGRRYATVGELSEDLHRHLAGLPVLARRDTFRYRSSKFVRRHKAAVVVAGLLALSLMGGVVATARQARIAEAHRARAERRFNDVRKLAHSLLFEVHDAIADLPGSTRARQLLVKRGLEYLDSLAGEAAGDVGLQRELAQAYEKLGDLQGKLNASNLGDTSGARVSYGKAMAIRESLAASHPADPEVLLDLSQSCSRQGEMRWTAGDLAGAAESHEKAARIAQQLLAKSPDDALFKRRLAVASAQRGQALAASGHFAAGLDQVRKGLALLEALAAASPSDTEAQARVAVVSDMTAGILVEMSADTAPVLAALQRSLGINERLSAAEPQNVRFRHDVAVSHNWMGDLLVRTGDQAGALASYRKAIAILESVSAADPSNESYRSHLAVIRTQAATIVAKTGDPTEALRELHEAQAVLEPLGRADPSNQQIRGSLASVETGLGHAEARRGHWREARQRFASSQQFWLEMRRRGLLAGAQAALPEELAREIARCDAALGEQQRSPAAVVRGEQTVPAP